MGSIDVLPALNTGKALWYSRMMSYTVLEITQIVKVDQLSGSVLTSVLSRTRALCIMHTLSFLPYPNLTSTFHFDFHSFYIDGMI